jgi:hypothetical protein
MPTEPTEAMRDAAADLLAALEELLRETRTDIDDESLCIAIEQAQSAVRKARGMQ